MCNSSQALTVVRYPKKRTLNTTFLNGGFHGLLTIPPDFDNWSFVTAQDENGNFAYNVVHAAEAGPPPSAPDQLSAQLRKIGADFGLIRFEWLDCDENFLDFEHFDPPWEGEPGDETRTFDVPEGTCKVRIHYVKNDVYKIKVLDVIPDEQVLDADPVWITLGPPMMGPPTGFNTGVSGIVALIAVVFGTSVLATSLKRIRAA